MKYAHSGGGNKHKACFRHPTPHPVRDMAPIASGADATAADVRLLSWARGERRIALAEEQSLPLSFLPLQQQGVPQSAWEPVSRW